MHTFPSDSASTVNCYALSNSAMSMSRAYNWIMNNNGGLSTEDEYGAYKAVDYMCNSKNVTGTVQLKDYFNITSGDQDGLSFAMFNHGPISVAIDASHP